MASKSFQEYKKLVSEITNGMEQVKQLRGSSSGNEECALEKMLTSYEEALSILSRIDPQGRCDSPTLSTIDPQGQCDSSTLSRIDPQGQCDSSTLSRIDPQGQRGSSTRRVTTPLDDGYAWRKYGQKNILKFKYPRSYYRCAMRYSTGCQATKCVQRLDDDPSVLDTTYRSAHTCTGSETNS